MTTKQEVVQLMADFELANPELAVICSALRELILVAAPDIDEGVKYGGIVYHRDGELLGGIFMSQKHVSLEFGLGAELEDEHGVLEGKGKYRRHLKFKTVSDIESKHTQSFVKQTY